MTLSWRPRWRRRFHGTAEGFSPGVKQKLEEAEDSGGTPAIPGEEEEPGNRPLALKVSLDGTVEQGDTVK